MKKFLCLLIIFCFTSPVFAELRYEDYDDSDLQLANSRQKISNNRQNIHEEIRRKLKEWQENDFNFLKQECNISADRCKKAKILVDKGHQERLKIYDEIIKMYQTAAMADYEQNTIKSDYSYAKKVNRQIEYGYNAKGDFVPTDIGGQHIEYGYNAKGQYVPMWYGNNPIEYGYNAVGDYVPLSY